MARCQVGEVDPTRKTAEFQEAAKIPVHVPLSGKPMEFDGTGLCVSVILHCSGGPIDRRYGTSIVTG
jgi:hypothetical protein